jgi:hypothetical protein
MTKRKLPDLVRKKYLLIHSLASRWCTIEELECVTGLSRSQIYRTIGKLKNEYSMSVYNQNKEGEAVQVYRIVDMGIINQPRFELLMTTIDEGV